MKRDALGLAGRLLKSRRLPASAFNEALDAILTLANSVKRWRPLVESAYRRVPKRDRGSVRFWMMAVRSACGDHEGVLQLSPKRFTGESALKELIYSIEATFALGNRKLMSDLAARFPRFMHQIDGPILNAQALLCLAEFYARQGDWDVAITGAELAQDCETLHRNAVHAIVEIHAARALLAIRRGFDRIERFNKNFDPTTELIVPGNDAAVQEQAAKEFRRLQRILEKVVPKERQKELGFG
jgi:hypothetical protein